MEALDYPTHLLRLCQEKPQIEKIDALKRGLIR
jgi:hypothetical protein